MEATICNKFHEIKKIGESFGFAQDISYWKQSLQSAMGFMWDTPHKESFLKDKFLPDWDRVVQSGVPSKDYLFAFSSYFELHPTFRDYFACAQSLESIAYQVWWGIDIMSQELSLPFQPGWAQLSKTKHMVSALSWKTATNLRQALKDTCSSSNGNVFCKLVPLAETIDKVEELMQIPDSQSDKIKGSLEILRVHLLLLPVWDPTNSLPLHVDINNKKFDFYSKIVEKIVNIVRAKQPEDLLPILLSLPPIGAITGCSATQPDRCLLYSLISQMTNYVKGVIYKPTAPGGAERKVIHSKVNYPAFIGQRTLTEVLNIAQSGETTLQTVALHLSQQIECTGDKLGKTLSTTFQDLQDYFTAMHSFDFTKAKHDVGYISTSLKTYGQRSVGLSKTVDGAMNEIISGALICAAHQVAYRTLKLAIAIAENSNPLGWLFGSNDADDLMEPLEELADAIYDLVVVNKLYNLLKDLMGLLKTAVAGLKRNAEFISSVKDLVKSLNIEDDSKFQSQQAEFLEQYGNYTPATTKPQLVEIGAYLESIVEEACELIDSADVPPVSSSYFFKNYVADSGLCLQTKVNIQKLMETYYEIYDFQFDLMEGLASFTRAKTGLNAAKNISFAWTSTVENCESFSTADKLARYAMLAGVSYTSYQLQMWLAVEEYCDILEYEDGGARPSVCQGVDTDISALVAYKTKSCEGNKDFTRYFSIPARDYTTNKYKNVMMGNNFAQLDIHDLFAGKGVEFQIPDSNWLIDHKWITPFEKDYAIYVKEFEVYLPVESSSPTSIAVRAYSTASNHLTPGSTTYAIKPYEPLLSEYVEGHGNPCRKSSLPNPYSLCGSSKPPNICLSSNILQQDFIPASIYSQWNLQVSGYEHTDIPIPATDMEIKIAMTLCKKSRDTFSQSRAEETIAYERSFTKCCLENQYWSNEDGKCYFCPNGTTSTLRGYFCQGIYKNRMSFLPNILCFFLPTTDINECDDTNSTGCDTLATCTNAIGSYTCNCNMGYRGDGKTCEGKHKARQSIFLVSHQRPLLFKLCRMNFHYRFLT